jgi:hypothetical protein
MTRAKGNGGAQNWAVYLAFAPMDKQFTLIKVGVSEVPLRRIYEVHVGCPFPIKAALWQYVGFKNRALSAEAAILKKLQQYSTRGEWLKMEMRSAEHKRHFHSIAGAAISAATGQAAKWNKTSIPAIEAALGIDWSYLNKVMT